MNVCETAVECRYLRRLEVDVLVHVHLAKQARPGHEGDCLGHLGPTVTGASLLEESKISTD